MNKQPKPASLWRLTSQYHDVVLCELLQRNTLRLRTCRQGEAGFSLLELMVVAFVLMVVSGIGLPLIANVIKQYRLSETGTDYANLLQQARTRAVQDDQFYTVLTGQDNLTNAYYAYVDLQGLGAYASPDPIVYLAQGITPESFASGPALSNLEAQFLPPGPGSINTVATSAAGPTFGPRGLPCTPQTSGGYTTCPSLNQPTSFITFFESAQISTWEAVTVTPAGRIRIWNCSDGSTWSPRN